MAEQITPLQQMLSACTGAVLTSLIMTPLDVVKVRLQSQPHPSSSGSISTPDRTLRRFDIHRHPLGNFFRINPLSLELQERASSRIHFKGTLDAVLKISRNEGVNALWRGLTPALAMSVPATVVYFVGYDWLKDYLRGIWGDRWHSYAPLVAGASARTIAASIISPLELIRTRMQAITLSSHHSLTTSPTRQVINELAQGIRRDGLRVLWRGLPPTLWRDVPFSAIYWTSYEHIKPYFQSNHLHLTSFEAAFLSGATSGIIAATLTTPFDVAKTYQQTTPVRGGTIFLLRKILRKEGLAGIFRGVGPRIAKVGPACAIMIASYEFGKSFFADSNEDMTASGGDEALRISGLLSEEF